MHEYDLNRFIDAQRQDYDVALAEIKRGKKVSHWMWYIFPQLSGLGHSGMARKYGVHGIEEAVAYLAHPILGPRLIAISKQLLLLDEDNATRVMGSPDDVKLRSCMTLFAKVPGADRVFAAVIEKYFGGAPDEQTLTRVSRE